MWRRNRSRTCLKADDFIEQAVMLGDRESYCVLLVVPSFPNLEAWARKSGINASGQKALLASKQVQEHLEARVMARLEGPGPLRDDRRRSAS